MKQETKERILRIPVIGHAAALAALPGKLRQIREELGGLRQAGEEQRRAAEEQRQTAEERWETAEERWRAATGTFDSLGRQIRDLQEQAGTRERAAEERRQAAERNASALAERIRAAEEKLTAEQDARRFAEGFRRLLGDGKDLSSLRTALSTHPAVWGPAERLRIDPEASVDACLFNTNSGRITVGRFSFAGPGVSLIAGSHDPRRKGFPRRDLQETEGCDIDIGEGVWLCAECTVLGPCRIGDNAVIAAGAVVLPGTEAEAGCLYAGVPARKVREISLEEQRETLERTAERFGGCLYTEGWYTAETIRIGDREATGHWMIREQAKILCLAGERTLRWESPLGGAEDRTLTAETDCWHTEIRPGSAGEIRIPAEAFGGAETGTLRISVSRLHRPGNGDPRSLGIFVY